MFLKRVVFKNIRCLEHLDLSFQVEPFATLKGKLREIPSIGKEGGGLRQWTLLLGENGAGKSTILQSIALLLAGSEGLRELLDAPERLIRGGTLEGTLRLDFVTQAGESKSIELSLRREENLREFFLRNASGLSALDGELKSVPHPYLTVGYGVSRRLSRPQTTPIKPQRFRNPRAQAVATLFDADALLYPIETWAIDLHYRRQAQGLKLIKRAFDNLLMGVDFLDIDRDRHELRFRTVDGIVSLTQLSEGYQNVAAWWGDLLYRMTEALGESQNPLSAHGLLLIDEIDLHLHPIWQRQLRQFLTEKLPNFQIVATTHSPLTAQQADEGELFFLSRPSPTDSPKLEPYLGIPRYLMVHQMLQSEAFGLETIDSKHVEDLRAAYRELAAKEKRSQREEQRLKRLRESLADLPDWSIESPVERRQRELLEKISQSLSQRANHD